MRDTFLSFSPPCLGNEEIEEVIDTLRSDWISTGPKVKRLENQFAEAIGTPDAVALSSATAALHLALIVLGIGPGDAVLTTTMTFCSTVHVIEHVGAHPVLVDVEPDTLNIDPIQVERKIAGLRNQGLRPKAIIPVHLYGHPCDMTALVSIAAKHGLAVVEDAAHSLPAKHNGRTIGSWNRSLPVPVLTAFSFYATKNLTTAEGGMLTGPPELLDEARIWGLHGMNRDAWKRYGAGGSWYYEVDRPGFKYNLTDIQAAIGLHQLQKLERFHQRRREIVQKYNHAFAAIPGLLLPIEKENVEHAWHLYVVRLNSKGPISRDAFIEQLAARNIGCSVHFIPIHLHPYYRQKYGFAPEDFPVALREYHRIVSLPLYPRMSEHDVEDVIEAVEDILIGENVPRQSRVSALTEGA
jgi:dTDP-4-amino-4,6-dideoxygalactose transaminase